MMSLAAALKPLSPLFPLSLFLCGRMSYDMRKLDCVCWNWFILTGFLQFSFNSSITIKKKSKWDLEQRAKWFYSEFGRTKNKQKKNTQTQSNSHTQTHVCDSTNPLPAIWHQFLFPFADFYDVVNEIACCAEHRNVILV